MTWNFLSNLSLEKLVAPVPPQEFQARYWEQRPMLVCRSNPDYYSGLFSLRDFDDAVTCAPNYVKLANAAIKRNASVNPASAEELEVVLQSMRDGGTLVLDQMQDRDPKLALLCRMLAAELGHRFQTNLYLTPPNGQGFTPHWDNHDVFILQVMGSKHWKIEKQRRVLPTGDESMGEEGRELRGDLESFVLEQGDLVYIPRGFVHAAECGSEASLHITLGVTGVFWTSLLQAAVRAAAIQDEQLRLALPLGFIAAGNGGVVKQLAQTFSALADEKFLSGVVEQFFDELVRTHKLDVAGQVTEFFQPRPPLCLDTALTRREAIVYRMHVLEDDSVRINYGARTIVFPSLFHPALDLVLNGTPFMVRDLPGDLEDEERIAFAERLLEEGLLVREAEPTLPGAKSGW